jgi:cytochrome c biogenesis protein CcmG/thiol:disulfide interchange protein DsbE
MLPKTRPPRQTLFLSLIAAGIFLLGAALIPWLTRAQDQALDAGQSSRPPASANYAAPELTLQDLDGNPVTLADFQGQVVLVNNWATWCPPCQSEMPALETYFEEHSRDGLVIVAIESGESLEQVTSFARQYGLTFTILLDPHATALEAFRNWNLPSTYIIDRDGTVVMSWTGEVDRTTLETYVTPLLNR